MRGLCWSYSGPHDRAVDDCSKAIPLAPDRAATCYNNPGRAFAEMHEPEIALPDLDRAIAMAPDYTKAWENRAIAYMAVKDYKLVVDDLTIAIELGPTAWQYTRRAEARDAIGHKDGAKADRKKAEEIQRPRRASNFSRSEHGCQLGNCARA